MLPSHLVKSWKDCKELFLNKFYPIQRTIRARKDIINFEQGSQESFSESWDRLKGYTRDCPHHGFEEGELLGIFYRGILMEHKWTLDAASNGSFSKLDVDQGELLVENLSRSFESYEELNDETPLEEPCQDSQEQIFHDELDMRARRIDEQQIEACLIQEHLQNKANLEVVHVNNVQEPWSTYAAQENQQELEMRGMLQQLLTEQAKLVDQSYAMEEKVAALSSKVMLLKHESPLPSTPIIEASIDDHEESLQEIERILYRSQVKGLMGNSEEAVEEKSEVGDQKVEYVGGYSTVYMVSPPKAEFKKKESCGKEALGYGNFETTLALDGSSLDSLFSLPIELAKTKGDCTKTTEEQSNDTHPILNEPSSCTMTLTPWKHEDGAVEYKIECKGRAKPFAKIKAILSTELKEKGQLGIQEIMGKVLLLEFRDPPWSVHTPLSRV